MAVIKSGFRRLKKKIAESRYQRRLKTFCSDLHYTGYACLPCGTLIWDGIGTVDELKQRYGEEQLRNLCMDTAFYSSTDTGLSTPGQRADLAYRLLSRLGSVPLREEMVMLLVKWRKYDLSQASEWHTRVRRLEALIWVTCHNAGLAVPEGITEPDFEQEMAAFADFSYG